MVGIDDTTTHEPWHPGRLATVTTRKVACGPEKPEVCRAMDQLTGTVAQTQLTSRQLGTPFQLHSTEVGSGLESKRSGARVLAVVVPSTTTTLVAQQ